MNNEFLLQIEELSVSFDGFKAVDDLTLYVSKEGVHAVIGPNGAGKTTLLDLITGRTRPTKGHVRFKGSEVTGLHEYQIVRKGIGRKFQTPSVYESLTVFENLEMAYPDKRSWVSAWRFRRTPEIVKRVEEIAELIYLGDRLHERAELLSHGQKQWLEIGALLIQDPELLLLDEPVAGMSVTDRAKTAELLSGLAKGRAVVVVEHDMDFVKKISDHVTVLHQGRLLAEGKMDVIQKNPKVVEVYLGH
ncbi:MAG TPA: urea ABC transporter ATP-binding protein UrtD [Polyangiaceae bacterium]|jgi:urea transport system ATP-binding protein|nr:urea ABC transporter ATP-binding protein UrtD [Polyangiaceae bacterium]